MEILVKNPHCQRLNFEVKMQQKTLGGRAPPGPAGGGGEAWAFLQNPYRKCRSVNETLPSHS